MDRSKLLSVAGVLVLAVFLFFWRLGDIPFHLIGEPREAVEIQEVVVRGEWVLPLRNGTELPSKPPLYHWLAGVAALATGTVDEASARLPSAVLATTTVAAILWFGARRWGVAAGAYAAAILATNFLWIRTARSARVDATLSACLTGAFLAGNLLVSATEPPRWALVVFYACMALAVLTKGPIGFILPSAAVVTYLAVRRDLRRLRRVHVYLGSALALAIPAVWYALAIGRSGAAFIEKHVLVENLNTFFGPHADPGTPPHPFYYVAPAFAAGFAPWTIFLIPLAVFLWQRRAHLESEGYLYPLVWFATVFVFFMVASGKRGEYLLPLYPAAALLLGAWWGQVSARHTALPVGILRLLQIAGCTVATVLLLMVPLLLAETGGGEPLEWLLPFLHRTDQANLPLVHALLRQHTRFLTLWALLLVPIAVALATTAWRQRWSGLCVAVVAFVVSTATMVNVVLYPALAGRATFKTFMATVRAAVPEDAELVFYNDFDYGAVFYWGTHIPVVDARAFDGPPEGRPRYVLMWEGDWTRLSDAQRAHLAILHVSAERGDRDQPLVLAATR